MLVARPLSMTPRTGRTLQRYEEGGVRLVTGCVPFYRGKVVMVSSSQGLWIVPKGGWEVDETVQEAAAREAYEEAGVLGTVAQPLPDVRFRNKKGGECRLLLYTMQVSELTDRWPESQQRRRQLFDLDEAIEKCGKPEMKLALEEMRRLGLHLPAALASAARNNPVEGGGPTAAVVVTPSETVLKPARLTGAQERQFVPDGLCGVDVEVVSEGEGEDEDGQAVAAGVETGGGSGLDATNNNCGYVLVTPPPKAPPASRDVAN